MKAYLDNLQHILDTGRQRKDRTGVGTLGVFGTQTRYNLKNSFPLLTTKRMVLPSVLSELLWFLEGSTDERRLCEIRHNTRSDDKATIWTLNAEDWNGKFKGDLGDIYGAQWRKWKVFSGLAKSEGDNLKIGEFKYVDQIANLIDGLTNDPMSRRHILSAWNVGEIDNMVLPPCHLLSQFYVNEFTPIEIENVYYQHRASLSTADKKILDVDREGRRKTIKDLVDVGLPTGYLDCQMYQRSGDMFLGVPYNIASYSLLTYMIAQVCNLLPGEFIHTIGDAHIYTNHISQVEEQLKRSPTPQPTLKLSTSITNIFDFGMDDFTLEDYYAQPKIVALMAV